MIYAFFADGFEEIEAVTPVDLLRRVGKTVKIVGVGKMHLIGSNGIKVQADINENDVVLNEDLEMIILPGGKNGTHNLSQSKTVSSALDFCIKNNRFIAAICAAPIVLGKKGILINKKATCYPGFESELTGAELSDEYIVVDGKVITAKGAGVSLDFGFTLVSELLGMPVAEKLRRTVQCGGK